VPKKFTKAPKLHHLDDGAVVDLADLRIGGDRLDPLDRAFIASPSLEATFTVPSSSM